MQDIVACAAEYTRQSGGKRVTPYHLCVVGLTSKRAIESNETFDFLKEIVEKVADPVAGGEARGTKRRRRDAPKKEAADDAGDDGADADADTGAGAPPAGAAEE